MKFPLFENKGAAAESKLSPKERETFIAEAFHAIRDAFISAGGTYFHSVSDLYQHFSKGSYVVRRENPKKLIQAVTNHQDLEFTFDPSIDKYEYANSAVWDMGQGSQGLENAFIEGFSDLEGIVMVEGFEHGKNIQVSEIPNNYSQFYGLDRRFVRSVKGIMHPEDLRFIILRIPGKYMPKAELTPDECDALEEKERLHVFRGFTFNTPIKNKPAH